MMMLSNEIRKIVAAVSKEDKISICDRYLTALKKAKTLFDVKKYELDSFIFNQLPSSPEVFFNFNNILKKLRNACVNIYDRDYFECEVMQDDPENEEELEALYNDYIEEMHSIALTISKSIAVLDKPCQAFQGSVDTELSSFRRQYTSQFFNKLEEGVFLTDLIKYEIKRVGWVKDKIESEGDYTETPQKTVRLALEDDKYYDIPLGAILVLSNGLEVKVEGSEDEDHFTGTAVKQGTSKHPVGHTSTKWRANAFLTKD